MNKKCLFILPLFFLCTACGSFGGYVRDFFEGAAGVAASALFQASGLDNTKEGKSYSAQAESNNKRLDDEIAQLEQKINQDPENADSYRDEIRKKQSQKQETTYSAILSSALGISKEQQDLGKQFYSGNKYDKRDVAITVLLENTTNAASKAKLGTKEEAGWFYTSYILGNSKVFNNCNKEFKKARTSEERKLAMDNCKKEYADFSIEWGNKMAERSAELAQIEKDKMEEREKRLMEEAQQYTNASEEEKIAWISQNWPDDEEFAKKIEEDGKRYDNIVQELIDSEQHRIAEEESENNEISVEENENKNEYEDEDEDVEEVEETESNEHAYETGTKGYETNGRQNAIEAINQTQVNSYRINSFGLTQEQKNSLDDVAKLLSDNEDLSITIIGHTCSMGSSYVNKLVGKKRAESAKKYLVKKGVSASRISVSTKGKSEPIDSNDTLQGRQANRRIEFRVD